MVTTDGEYHKGRKRRSSWTSLPQGRSKGKGIGNAKANIVIELVDQIQMPIGESTCCNHSFKEFMLTSQWFLEHQGWLGLMASVTTTTGANVYKLVEDSGAIPKEHATFIQG